MTSLPFKHCLAGLLALGGIVEWAQGALPAAVQAQIEELQAEKEGRTPAQQKIESHLVLAMKRRRGVAFSQRVRTLVEQNAPVEADGAALVDLRATVTPALLEAIAAVGGTVVESVPRFEAVRARMPLDRLEEIAARPEVRSVRRGLAPITHVTSEGDVALGTGGANGARATYGVDGTGVRVGVISDSATYLTASQASGELPAVTVLQDVANLTGEGTAMMEIVHDLAPGAQLFFATGYISEAGFAQNFLNLRAAGCDIVVDDLAYFDESPFQDGPVAQAIEQVVADGGLVFTAAGNEGNLDQGTAGAWEGDFADGGATAAPITKAGRLHDFGGGETYDVINAPGYAETLFWSDAKGASANDYDLYVLDSTGSSILAFSNNTQNGSQDPFEIITQSVPSGSRLVIVKAASAANRYLQVASIRGRLARGTAGKISGHCGCASTISVAAVNASAGTPFTAANRAEFFTSDGPRRMFYNSDGTAITPGNFSSTGGRVLAKPDLAAADGVSTSVPGFLNFYGTSAAAPHAAAVAALLKSQNLGLSARAIRAELQAHTLDIEGAGFDRDSGAGIIQAAADLGDLTEAAKVAATGITLTGEGYTPANGAPDPGERVTVQLSLRNAGAVATNTLTATLLPTGGVSAPSDAVAIGALAARGGTGTAAFSFNANGIAGTTLTATFQLSDGAQNYGTVSRTFTLGITGTPQTFSNSTAITIRDRSGTASASATPYPATIAVSGLSGRIGKASVQLHGFTHAAPGDVDVLLVSPSGKKLMLLSDAGGATAANGTELTFTDDGATTVTPSISGAYHPIDLEAGDTFPSPAPRGPYAAALAPLNGDDPNGTWSLYIADDTAGNAGSIAGGWSLVLAPAVFSSAGTGPDLALVDNASATVATTGQQIVYTATIYNHGAQDAAGVTFTDTLPSQLSYFSGSTTLGSLTRSGNRVTVNLGMLAAQKSATVTITATASTVGSFAHTAAVATTGTDLSSGNDSVLLAGAVSLPNLAPSAPGGWSAPLVVSDQKGATGAGVIPSGVPLLANFGLANVGAGPAPAGFYNALQVDGTTVRTFTRQLALTPGSVAAWQDVPLPLLAAGSHTFRLVTDANGDVAETNEGDNVYTATLVVGSPPTIATSSTAQILEDGTLSQAVTIGDAETAAGSLTLTAASSDPTLLPLDRVTLTGTGASRMLTLQPAPDANGRATVTLTVQDGDGQTSSATVQVTVAGVNDSPTLAAISNPDAILEDAGSQLIALTGISAGPANEAGQHCTITAASSDHALLADPVVTYGGGSSGSLAFTPVADAFGTATITVTVQDDGGTANDGVDTLVRQFTVTVNPVNDPPTLAPLAGVTVNEDAGGQTVALAGIGTGAANEHESLTVSAVSTNPALIPAPSVSYTSPAAAGSLSFTPATNASGTSQITVTVDDGQVEHHQTSQSFTVTVNPVNDPPSFTAGASQAVNEDAGAQTVMGWATNISAGPPDEADQTLSFLVTNDAPGLFSAQPAISPQGTLTYTPAPDANGEVQVTVKLKDSGGGDDTSGAASFAVTVLPVNDPPIFTAGGDVRVLQNAGAQSVPWATEISPGPANEAGQSVQFTIQNEAPQYFSVQPAISPDGVLTFSPASDLSGTIALGVTLQDSGGTARGGQDGRNVTRPLRIQILPINHAPSFASGPSVKVTQGVGAQTIPHWATAIRAGPAAEDGQALNFTVSVSDPALFEVQPAISPAGALSFMPALRGSGTAEITVRLHDDGGTAEGGSDTSDAQSFTISVTTYAEELGRYQGLVTAPDGLAPTFARSGFVSLTVQPRGLFTGQLVLGGRRQVLQGSFDLAGRATFKGQQLEGLGIPRPGEVPLILTLTLDVSGGTDQITGTLAESETPFAIVTADRALYSAAPQPVAPYRPVPAALQGRYTVLFAARAPSQTGLAATDYPHGDGVGTLSVAPNGLVRMLGTLANGRPVSAAALLSKTNRWPLYALLAGGRGALTGPVQFAPVAGESDLTGPELHWYEPVTTRQGPYAGGWPGGIAVDALGSRYRALGPGQTLPFGGLAPAGPGGNVLFRLSGGGIAGSGLDRGVNFLPGARAFAATPGADRLTVSLFGRTGLLAGRFVHPGTGAITGYRGVLLQTPRSGGGFFLTPVGGGQLEVTPRP